MYSARKTVFICNIKQLQRLRETHVLQRNLTKETKSPPNSVNHDMIGPPDPVSNLRPIVFHKPTKETDIERRFRQEREKVQKWNQEFWHKHNKSFFEEKKDYVTANITTQNEGKAEKRQTLTADEMSVFYKAFLDKNWKKHFWYNMEWYRKNIGLVILALKVNTFNFKQRFGRRS